MSWRNAVAFAMTRKKDEFDIADIATHQSAGWFAPGRSNMLLPRIFETINLVKARSADDT